MNTKKLNELKERAYNIAVDHGFHEEVRPDAYWLGLVMSEMGEAINADRKGLHADIKGFIHYMDATKFYFRKAFDSYIKDSVEDEIADIVIRLLDFAGMKGYGLQFRDSPLYRVSAMQACKRQGFVPTLFDLISPLGVSLKEYELELCCSAIIIALSGCFEEMTKSDKDLWWFVEQKMRYNEQRPKLSGKRY